MWIWSDCIGNLFILKNSFWRSRCLVNLVKWSLIVSGRLCSIVKPWNHVSAFITDWDILSVEDVLLPGKNSTLPGIWMTTSLAFPLCFAVPKCFVTSLWPPWLIEKSVLQNSQNANLFPFRECLMKWNSSVHTQSYEF